VRRTRDQVQRRTRQEHRQGALQRRRRVNAKKDGPRTGEGVSCIECGPTTVDGSPSRLIAVSEADNPVLGRWIEADNPVPKMR
jgi:hypothetical protein